MKQLLNQQLNLLQNWIDHAREQVSTPIETVDPALSEAATKMLLVLAGQTPEQNIWMDWANRLLTIEREQRLLAETLGEVFLALTAQTDLDAVLDEIFRQVARLVSYSAANIAMLENDHLKIVRYQGYQAFQVDSSSLRPEQSLENLPLVAWAVQQRQPLVVSDIHHYSNWGKFLGASWVQSFIIIPICAQNQVLGLFRLDSDVPGKFSEQDSERLLPLAHAAAIAIENAQLYDRVRLELAQRKQAEQEASQLNQKLFALQFAAATIATNLDLQYVLNALTREITSLLDVEGCYISKWAHETDTVSVIANYGINGRQGKELLKTEYNVADYPFTQRVLQEGTARQTTISRPDIDPAEKAFMQYFHFKTLLMLPMEFQEQVVGLVEVVDSRNENIFTLQDIALAQLLANQAAIAMENARLYQQTQREIEERKQIAVELKKLSLAVEQSPSVVIITDTAGVIEYVNPKFTAVTGYTLEETVGKNPRFLKSGEMPSSEYQRLWDTISAGEEWNSQFHNRKKNGELFWVSASISPIKNDQSQITHYLAMQLDVTQYKAAQESLQRSESNLKAIFKASQQAFMLIDQNLSVQAFNTATDKIITMAMGQKLTVGILLTDFVYPHQMASFNSLIGKVFNGEVFTGEYEIPMGDKKVWFEVTCVPIYASDGQITGVCFNAVDVDQRKRLLDTLAQSEAQLLAEIQSLLDINNILITEANIQKLLDYTARQSCNLLQSSGAAVLLFKDNSRQLELVSCTNKDIIQQTKIYQPYDNVLIQQAITSQQVQINNQVAPNETNNQLFNSLSPLQVCSALCAPLTGQNENFGVLLVWDNASQKFTHHSGRLMVLFASQAALALQNTYLVMRNHKLAIERERHRLARELHDTVTQSLYGIGMAAKTALRQLARPQHTSEDVREPIEMISTLANEALAGMREQIHMLASTLWTNTSLAQALTSYCRLLMERHNIVIKLEIDPDLAVPKEHRDSIYAIAKEAVWNVVKHAQATQVTLRLTTREGRTILTIKDDGIGFDPAVSRQRHTLGLATMEERTMLMGGTFAINSSSGQGSLITISIPNQPGLDLSDSS